MSTTVIPINPAQVQWLAKHKANYSSPECLVGVTSPATAIFNLGDVVLASNRCACFAATQTTNSSCQYISVSSATNTAFVNSCGTDATCKTGCQVVGSFSTASSNPCTSNYITGAISSSDYTTTALWDPGFNTNYFYYYSFSMGDTSCSSAFLANRIPVYPTCTLVMTGVYALTLQNANNGQLELYGCSDSKCNTCQLAYTDTRSNTCVIDSNDSGTFFTIYREGGVFNNPLLALPSGFPNQTVVPTTTKSVVASLTPSATPSPDTQSSGNSAAIIGGTVGGILALAVLVGGIIAWRRFGSKNPKQDQARPTSTLSSTASQPRSQPTVNSSVVESHQGYDTRGAPPPPASQPYSSQAPPVQPFATQGFAHPQHPGHPYPPHSVPAQPLPGQPLPPQQLSPQAPYQSPRQSFLPSPHPSAPYGAPYASDAAYPAGQPYPVSTAYAPNSGHPSHVSYSAAPYPSPQGFLDSNGRPTSGFYNPSGPRDSFQSAANVGTPPNYHQVSATPAGQPVFVDEKFQLGSYQRPAESFGQPTSVYLPAGMPGPSSTSDESKAASRYVAIKATSRDDAAGLALNIGDVVLVAQEFQNGYAQAFNQTTGLSGRIHQDSVAPLGAERFLPS
ncbi:uncharacterized protein BJ171DRAFT_569682 [Polychytrium aggregatum]|uniref:uncharacterized protein n=1 Tax=Polychytrium aggregatum TaxID=110093 RepID=UPI0022FDF888|nr:uncharacterized protein BJ171DRAFT_569682 [Polychytrium aggregatum]KAI9202490.1 hypothetical protein BJ171DRAFT_569682 [Polychytrium aggregatum]